MNSSTSAFRNSWKRILPDLLAFFFFLFLFDRLLFIAFRKGETYFYRNMSAYSLQDKFSQIKNKKEYPILILGTSRTFDGIHPGYIQEALGVKAFKEAFVGKGPMYNYYFYQEYKKAMGVPRVVIYGLDYFLFNITSVRPWMKRFDTDVVDAHYFSGGVSLLLANKPKIDEFVNTLLDKLKSAWGEDENFLIEKDMARMEDYRGVISPGTIDSVEPPQFKKIIFFEYPGKEGEFFSKLLDELHRDGVQVMLVALPEYIGTFRSNSNHRRFIHTFQSFQKKYDNVLFYNYDNFRKFPLAKVDFFIDGGYGKTNSHLSRPGAKFFNRQLIKDLRWYFPAR